MALKRAEIIQDKIENSGLKKVIESPQIYEGIERKPGRPKKGIKNDEILKTTLSAEDKNLFLRYCEQAGAVPSVKIRELIIQFLKSMGYK